MLDAETKRRIDTCRDILVGKVPDPKSQVEQITVALIYKFMDDMDLEAEEMGGRPTFFTGEYGKFRWSKLVATGVTGQEMLNTYSEALTRMVENDGLPALFRQIFRNAYLPYRDPETLRSFLREINSFTYDHSERLGDAFEYLLSVLGSQGDAGQFRTPRHIIDFMVEVIDPQKNEVIMDPACGTAGFLISAYKHILKMNSSDVANGNRAENIGDAAEQAIENPKRFSGDMLSQEDRQRLARNIKGYDISPDMVRLSLVNLYLHGFADPKVEEYDTLTSEDKWTEMADVVLANPPFMSPKGGIKPHTKFQVQSKRSEVLFVDYIAEHLTPNGRAAIVVPEGIIFQSQSAYVALRKMLVENHLAAVISLPAGVFNPYSGVKTSILILDRAVAKASKHVAFFKIENDGFQLGAQRKAQKGSQLPTVKAELTAWLQAARGGAGEELENGLGNAVERELVGEGGEFNLSAERYASENVRSSNWDYRTVGQIAPKVGESVLPETLQGPVEYIGLENIVSEIGALTGDTLVAEPSEIKSTKTVFECSDVLYGKLRPNLNKVWLADRSGICSTDIFALRANTVEVEPLFLASILRGKTFNEKVLEKLRGAQLPRIGWKDFAQIEIPLPPLEVQREIVAEIEGYQRVIDGARSVIANYRPHIPIDPEWPREKLDQITNKITDGTHKTPTYTEAGVPFLRVTDLTGSSSKKKFISEEEHLELIKRCNPENGDILYSKNGTIGVAKMVDWEFDFSIFVSLALLKPKNDLIISKYLEYFLNTPDALQQATSRSKSGTVTNLHLVDIKTMQVPLPSIMKQQAIVDELNAEHEIIKGNRDLITRFEKKIDAAIACVWGEAKADEDRQ